MSNIISIDEYAKRNNVSKAYVYSLLKTTMAECVVKKNGVKFIDLDKINKPTEENEEEELHNTNTVQPIYDRKDIDKYKEEIERLKKELEEERAYNREKDKRILELLDKVMKLTENTQTLTLRIQEQNYINSVQSNQLLIDKDSKVKDILSFFKRKKNRE